MNDFIRLLRLNIKMCTLSTPAVSEKVKVICLKVVGNVMCRVADRVPATLAIRMVPEIRLRYRRVSKVYIQIVFYIPVILVKSVDLIIYRYCQKNTILISAKICWEGENIVQHIGIHL